MSTFHQSQHKLAWSAVASGEFETFRSIIMDPSMVTLDPPFYLQIVQLPDRVTNNWHSAKETYKISREYFHNIHEKRTKLYRDDDKNILNIVMLEHESNCHWLKCCYLPLQSSLNKQWWWHSVIFVFTPIKKNAALQK